MLTSWTSWRAYMFSQVWPLSSNPPQPFGEQRGLPRVGDGASGEVLTVGGKEDEITVRDSMELAGVDAIHARNDTPHGDLTRREPVQQRAVVRSDKVAILLERD